MESKNEKTLNSFVEYCKEHPDYRFWQALRNWTGYNFVLLTDENKWINWKEKFLNDTYFWEGKGVIKD